MTLSQRIAGPFAILAALALLLAGGLFLQAATAGRHAGMAGGEALTLAGHLAAAREAQAVASGIVSSGLAAHHDAVVPASESPGLPAADSEAGADADGQTAGTTAAGPGGAAGGFAIRPHPNAHALLHDAVATALSNVDAMRTLASGRPYEPAIDRLGLELSRWRQALGRLAIAEAAGQGAPQQALDAVASQGRLIRQLSDSVAQRLAQAQAVDARSQRVLALRTAGVAVLGVVLVALGLGLATLQFSRRLARDMANLPQELGGVVRGERWGALGAESRKDEVGVMARELRTLAERMHLLTQSSAEMEKMALTDPLTGLPNRRGLHDFLARAATQQDRGGPAEAGRLAVIHIDLDHFKAINDTYGHEVGDNVLRESTRRMASVIRDSDIIARLGGDEFVIIARGLTSTSSLERLVSRILHQFDAPIIIRNRTLQVTASVGAVLGDPCGGVPDPKRLLTNADTALGHAKAAGRNGGSIFTSAMAHDARRRQEQAAELRAGIDRGEFRIWFHAVVDVRDGKTAGLDMVLRWYHPEQGVLHSDAFLDAAEANNLSESLIFPPLEQALRHVSNWRDAGANLPVLHVPMTRTMLLAPDIVDRFSCLFDQHRIQPRQIAIKITERFCSGRGFETVFANLRRLSGLGAGIIVDEFGSVDAALGTITRLGAETIKLDVAQTGGLVARENWRPADGGDMQALLPGILGIGKSLGVTVIAKRVVDHAQRDSLRALGFTLMQGDAMAPALDVAATGQWLTRGATDGGSSGAIRLVAG